MLFAQDVLVGILNSLSESSLLSIFKRQLPIANSAPRGWLQEMGLATQPGGEASSANESDLLGSSTSTNLSTVDETMSMGELGINLVHLPASNDSTPTCNDTHQLNVGFGKEPPTYTVNTSIGNNTHQSNIGFGKEPQTVANNYNSLPNMADAHFHLDRSMHAAGYDTISLHDYLV